MASHIYRQRQRQQNLETVMDERELREAMIKRKLNLNDGSHKEMATTLESVLRIIIPPRSPGDRATLRAIGNWYYVRICTKRDNPHELSGQIVALALEASGPRSRKPAAVWVHLLKKELGFPN